MQPMTPAEFGTDRLSDTLLNGTRVHPIDNHGKLRFARGLLTASAANGGAVTTGHIIGMFTLPPGRLRILNYLSGIACSAFGASRVLNIGHLGYEVRSPGVVEEAADPNALATSVNVAAALNGAAFDGPMTFDIYSKAGVPVTCQVTGGTIPLNGTLEITLAYLYE